MGDLFHLVPKDTWVEHKAAETPYYPNTYEQDGFTHLTKDPGFLLGVANNFYRATTPWNWICLRIDPKKLTHEVKYETAAAVGSTAPSDKMQGKGEQEPVLFPHLYGTIDFDAVTAEHAVERDGHTGEFLRIHDVT